MLYGQTRVSRILALSVRLFALSPPRSHKFHDCRVRAGAANAQPISGLNLTLGVPPHKRQAREARDLFSPNSRIQPSDPSAWPVLTLCRRR